MFLSLHVKQAMTIPLQKKERERLKERAENWKRIEALAAENPDMEAIAKQLQSMNLKPSGGGAVVSIDDILVDDSGGGNGNNSEDEPNDIAAKIEEETSATAAVSKSAKTPTPSLPPSSRPGSL